MSSDRTNPYEINGSYWFIDKNSVPHGPYKDENTALLALLLFVEKQRVWRENSERARIKNKGSGETPVCERIP